MLADFRRPGLFLRIQLLVAVLASLTGCASLGTHTRWGYAELMSDVKTVAVWPIVVYPLFDYAGWKTFGEDPLIQLRFDIDPEFEDYAESLSVLAETRLIEQLNFLPDLKFISADSVANTLYSRELEYNRFSNPDWKDWQNLMDVDAFLITHVKFGREADGVNSYVALSMCEPQSTREIVMVEFNTHWGKSYLFEKGPETTLPDAIEGAVNGLRKALARAPSVAAKRTAAP